MFLQKKRKMYSVEQPNKTNKLYIFLFTSKISSTQTKSKIRIKIICENKESIKRKGQWKTMDKIMKQMTAFFLTNFYQNTIQNVK